MFLLLFITWLFLALRNHYAKLETHPSQFKVVSDDDFSSPYFLSFQGNLNMKYACISSVECWWMFNSHLSGEGWGKCTYQYSFQVCDINVFMAHMQFSLSHFGMWSCKDISTLDFNECFELAFQPVHHSL